MKVALIAVVLLAVWTSGVFYAGWSVRDGRADTAVAVQATAVQAQRADVAEQGRAGDHANAQASAGVEASRIERGDQREKKFTSLKTEVVDYAKATATPDPAVSCPRGNADARFLRTWDEATDAAYQRAGHHDSADANGRAERAAATYGER